MTSIDNPNQPPYMNMNSPQEIIINKLQKNKSNDLPNFSYISKFKTAIYGFILFIILSNKISYKIINMIFLLFTKRSDIINEREEPMPLGIFINALIMGFILFMF